LDCVRNAAPNPWFNRGVANMGRKIYLVGAVTVLAILCMIPSRAVAQTDAEKAQLAKDAEVAAAKRAGTMKAALSAPTPMLPDGHPDLSGVWGGGQGLGTVHKDAEGVHVLLGEREAPKSLDPDGKLVNYYVQVDGDRRRAQNPNKPPYKDELLAKVHQLDKEENQVDPVVSCHPTGEPRAFPTQIFATPSALVFFYTGENSSHFRLIPMSTTHPEGAPHTYWGDSIAHWEGDTLVVDSIDFNDKTWLGSDGWFHSENMHVAERFRREGNVLHYDATVEDPDVFIRPWVSTPRTILLNNDPNNYVFEDLPCMDFDHSHIVNHDHF